MLSGIARYLRAHHLALLALFVALGGTSVAATNLINGSHIKPHSIPKNRLTKTAITSLHGSKGAQGTPGPQGPPGSQGPRGATGPQGPSSWDNLAGTTCTTEQGAGHVAFFYASQGSSHDGAVNQYGSGTWLGVNLCLTPDDLEPNDSQGTSTVVNSFYTSLIYATIYPSGDNDWYKLTATDLSGHSIYLTSLRDETATAPETFMDVYRDTTKVATGVVSYAVPAASGSHDWFVRVYSTKSDFYELQFAGTTASKAAGTSSPLRTLLGAHS